MSSRVLFAILLTINVVGIGVMSISVSYANSSVHVTSTGK